MNRETAGIMRMTLEAAKQIDVKGRNPADLDLVFDVRVTRSDGITGRDSLKLVQGGGVSVTDAAGKEVFRAGSPSPARVALVVNGGAPIEVDLPATRGWPTFMTLDIPLAGQCLRKTNDIRLEGCGETLSLDYIQVF